MSSNERGTRLTRSRNNDLLLLMLLFCGLNNRLPVVAAGESLSFEVGVLDFPEMLDHAKRALNRCPQKDIINLTTIDVSLLNEPSLLQQARQVKKDVNADQLAIIGPLHDAVVLVTDDMEIPYLTTELGYHGNARNILYILPRYRNVIDCVLDLVKLFKWTYIGVLWEKHSGDSILSDFMELFDIDVKISCVRPDDATDVRNKLHSLRQSGIRDVVLFISPPNSRLILNVAKQLGMLSVPYSFIIFENGRLREVEEIFADLQTNVTIIQTMLDGGKTPSLPPGNTTSGNSRAIMRSVSLICDVIGANPAVSAGMNPGNAREKVHKIREAVKSMFGQDRTTGFVWNIYWHTNYRLTKMGQWIKENPPNDQGRLDLLPSKDLDSRPQWPQESVRVVTILEKPWTMLKEPHARCSGNDCFEGFVVDLMAEIAKLPVGHSHVDYELYVVPDGLFGSLDPLTMEWNGIMGELVSGNATLSLAPLSINKQREEAVDFTKPFKTRGITVLIKTPESYPSYFQFLDPLSYQVWCVILLAMVVMSILLSIFEKFGTRQRRDMAPVTGQESWWFAFGTLTQGGTEVAPVTVAGRILTAAWWFVTMILISSYTANLAAFLTVKKINTPIESVSDLAGQTKIKYGTVRDSGVLAFFSTTQIEPYRTMARRMGPDTLVNDTSEGLERVLREPYAFLWDNTVNSYIASTDCRFTEIGPPFDYKGFGIGLPPGATYRENLTLAILTLADSGVMDQLQEKWWKGHGCDTDGDFAESSGDTEELELENVAGIFFVLAAGIVLGLVACVVDKYTIIFVKKQKVTNRFDMTSSPNAL